jgi:hypothetical protein
MMFPEKRSFADPVDYEAFCKATCQEYSQRSPPETADPAIRIEGLPFFSVIANAPRRESVERKSAGRKKPPYQ